MASSRHSGAASLAVVAALASVFGSLWGIAPASAHPTSGRYALKYAPAPAGRDLRGKRGARAGHLVNLVGDRESGLGFYALPGRFRVHGQPGREPGGAPGDAIRYAVATEAGTHYYSTAGDYGRERSGRTLFNPVDGYGSPFFAGYYGPAGDPDEERGPFGRPYN